MPIVHQFAYGVVNPVVAFCMAFAGSMFGLTCTARARIARTPGRRARWLLLGALAIGGGMWLMHFMAILGFDVPATDIRFDPALTGTGLGIAVVVFSCGLFLVGWGTPSFLKVFFGGVLTGSGLAAMHYTGMAATHFGGRFTYDTSLVAISVLIAIGAATAVLWFAVVVRGWKAISAAAAIMAVAMCAMHYTAMAALRVHLYAVQAPGSITGLSPLSLILPIIVLGAAAAICLIFGAISMMSDEEFNAAADLHESIPVSPALGSAGGPDTLKPVSLRAYDAHHKKAALRSHRG